MDEHARSGLFFDAGISSCMVCTTLPAKNYSALHPCNSSVWFCVKCGWRSADRIWAVKWKMSAEDKSSCVYGTDGRREGKREEQQPVSCRAAAPARTLAKIFFCRPTDKSSTRQSGRTKEPAVNLEPSRRPLTSEVRPQKDKNDLFTGWT